MGSVFPLAPELRNAVSATVNEIPAANVYGLFMNQFRNSALKQLDVRRALDYAVRRDRIVEEIFYGVAKPANTPVPAFLDEYASAYNPDEAERLIGAWKTKNGKIEITITVPDSAELKKVAEYARQDWLAVGVDTVNIATIPTSEFVDTVLASRDYDVLLFGETLEEADDLFPFWHSSQKLAPGLNLALYENKVTDQALERIRSEVDPDARRVSLRTVDERIASDVPAVFLFSLPYTYLQTENVGGFAEQAVNVPEDRFRNVSDWYVMEARVFK
jgi:peptide/nickel transport system substrate-binding protein